MALNYDKANMETCEYIEAMRKVYFPPPKQSNGKCDGFKNKYNGNVSNVCRDCNYLKGIIKNDDE